MKGQVQLTLDLSKVRHVEPPKDGKKLKRIGAACSEDFKDLLDLVCRLRGSTESELTFEYVLRGIREDLGNVFMAEPHLDKTLREAIRKFF